MNKICNIDYKCCVFGTVIMKSMIFTPVCKNDSALDLINAPVGSLTARVQPCKYYDINDIPTQNLNFLSVIHVNIRSLQTNFDSLQEFLCSLPYLPHIICLSETRLNYLSLTNIDLPRYKLLHADSTTRAEGVAIYLSINVTIHITSNPDLDIIRCENLSIKLNCPDVIIGLIYRHPKNDIKLFYKN